VALTPCVFFRQFFFLLDYAIITVSLVLEIVFHTFKEDIYQSLVGLLVIVRIWRFVRIGHGIAEFANEMAHKEYHGLLEYTEELEKRLKANNIDLPESGDYKKKSSDRLGTFLEKLEQDEQRKSHGRDNTIEESVKENSYTTS